VRLLVSRDPPRGVIRKEQHNLNLDHELRGFLRVVSIIGVGAGVPGFAAGPDAVGIWSRAARTARGETAEFRIRGGGENARFAAMVREGFGREDEARGSVEIGVVGGTLLLGRIWGMTQIGSAGWTRPLAGVRAPAPWSSSLADTERGIAWTSRGRERRLALGFVRDRAGGSLVSFRAAGRGLDLSARHRGETLAGAAGWRVTRGDLDVRGETRYEEGLRDYRLGVGGASAPFGLTALVRAPPDRPPERIVRAAFRFPPFSAGSGAVELALRTPGYSSDRTDARDPPSGFSVEAAARWRGSISNAAFRFDLRTLSRSRETPATTLDVRAERMVSGELRSTVHLVAGERRIDETVFTLRLARAEGRGGLRLRLVAREGREGEAWLSHRFGKGTAARLRFRWREGLRPRAELECGTRLPIPGVGTDPSE
jgi:hypothetical protein